MRTPRLLPLALRPLPLAIAALCGGCAATATPPEPIANPADFVTVAEASGWRATSTHAEVVELVERLDAASERIHVESAGATFEGRDLPLLVVADPPVRSPEDVGDRTVVFAWGGIHSGEVCGKPATLMLARELAAAADPALLDDLVVLLLPLLNADGNDRMSPDNRPGQEGPVEGMGTRPNAQGLNINRDWTKLETPAARAVVGVLNRWDPLVAMDLHTTNGSLHQYTLTWDGPRHPDTDPELLTYTRDTMLPSIATAMEASSGYKSFSYGNLNRDRTQWRTYPAQARYSTHYLGLRHVFGILSEAYSYASYEDRVLATKAFVEETFRYAAAHRGELEGIRERAIARTVERGADPGPDDLVTLQQRSVLREEEEPLLGYEGLRRGDDWGEPMTHTVRRDDRTEPIETAPLPKAYVLHLEHRVVLDTLTQHGIRVERVDEAATLEVEAYVVSEAVQAEREYEGHRLTSFQVEALPIEGELPVGTWVVTTSQPLGALAAHLLEPRAEDGLGTWFGLVEEEGSGFMGPDIRVFPVARLRGPLPSTR